MARLTIFSRMSLHLFCCQKSLLLLSLDRAAQKLNTYCLLSQNFFSTSSLLFNPLKKGRSRLLFKTIFFQAMENRLGKTRGKNLAANERRQKRLKASPPPPQLINAFKSQHQFCKNPLRIHFKASEPSRFIFFFSPLLLSSSSISWGNYSDRKAIQ